MICFRDMAFCTASVGKKRPLCSNYTCPRQFTEQQRQAAFRWKKVPPIAFGPFWHGCDIKEERQSG